MGLLKKKGHEPDAAEAPAGAPAPADESAAPRMETDDDAAVSDALFDEEKGAGELPVQTAVPEEPAEGAGGEGTDALLNMFQTTQAEAEDRSLLLELAGEADLGDLIEELQTVAAALGISSEYEAAA